MRQTFLPQPDLYVSFYEPFGKLTLDLNFTT